MISASVCETPSSLGWKRTYLLFFGNFLKRILVVFAGPTCGHQNQRSPILTSWLIFLHIILPFAPIYVTSTVLSWLSRVSKRKLVSLTSVSAKYWHAPRMWSQPIGGFSNCISLLDAKKLSCNREWRLQSAQCLYIQYDGCTVVPKVPCSMEGCTGR